MQRYTLSFCNINFPLFGKCIFRYWNYFWLNLNIDRLIDVKFFHFLLIWFIIWIFKDFVFCMNLEKYFALKWIKISFIISTIFYLFINQYLKNKHSLVNSRLGFSSHIKKLTIYLIDVPFFVISFYENKVVN